ncbi:hypothetical protein [Cellulomonas endometrii]|uniref:hypothetical protein n=1 Tax=Cellulomonas endometrii TaxID=3036301 RepID=UPI0024AE1495|nr:hypothetical protein [Cellulomonas endometrii]
MSATTRPLFPARSAARQGPVLRTAVSLLAWFGQIALWYWALVLVVVVALPFVIGAVGEVGTSILWFARQSGVWFPFSVLIGVATSYPPVHVASGMTRRAYVRGALVAAFCLAAAFALLMAGGLMAERAWYGAMGWEWSLQDQGWFDPDLSFGTLLVAYLATFVVAYVSGLLVGTVYASAGGWWGTLTLPLTAGPSLLMTILVGNSNDWVPFSHLFGGDGEGTPLALVLTVALVLTLALATAFWLIATRRSIAPRRG